MYTTETVESLNAYADRLRQDATRYATVHAARRGAVRSLVRRVRRSA